MVRHRRNLSSSTGGMDLETNKNISWLRGAGLSVFYLVSLSLVPLVLVIFLSGGLAWTIANCLHCIVSILI